MYLQQTTLNTLDVITMCVILHVCKVLPFVMLLLEWLNMDRSSV